jgi:hypothetical protein
MKQGNYFLNRTLLSMLFFLVSTCYSFSQTTIEGMVTDSSRSPFAGANVLLYRLPDSAFIKGGITGIQGEYSFAGIKLGIYYLKVSAQGTTTVFQQVQAENVTVKVAAIQLLPEVKKLANITIVARKDLYEQKIDRLVINVGAQSINSGGTALEVLQRAPGVMVDNQTSEIALMGKDGVQVYLDGKQTFMTPADVVAMLRAMPSDNIDKIEIITNPSAKYDAAGNSGIINIVRKKNNSFGTNGQITATIGTGRYIKERAGLQLNHRGKKISLFGSYNLVAGGDYWDFKKTGQQSDSSAANPTRLNYSAIQTDLKIENTSHNFKLGADAELSGRSSLGFVYTLLTDERSEDGPAISSFSRTENGPLHLRSVTDKTQQTDASNHLFNLNYSLQWKKHQAQFTADADYGYFKRDFGNYLSTFTDISTEGPTPLPFGFLNAMPTTIIIKSAKADINWQPKKTVKYEAGVKMTNVSTANYLRIYEGDPGKELYNPALDNEFNYKEDVYAAYFNVSGKLNAKTEYQAGLRFEQTVSNANSVTLSEKQKRNYGNLFPSLFLRRNMNDKQSMAFSYSYRLDRPNYQDMNPGRRYIDPYSFVIGSPYLQPQYTHAVEWRYNHNKSFFVSVGVNIILDNMQNVNRFTDGNKFYRRKENIGKAQMFTLTSGYTENITKNWQVQLTALMYYNQLQLPFEGVFYKFKNLAGRININSSIRFGKGWAYDMAFWYNTPKRRLLGIHQVESSLDMGIQKTFSSKWKFKLAAQDMLYTVGPRSLSDEVNFKQFVRIKNDTRMVLLTANYVLGNQKVKAAKNRKTGIDEESKRAVQQ